MCVEFSSGVTKNLEYVLLVQNLEVNEQDPQIKIFQYCG